MKNSIGRSALAAILLLSALGTGPARGQGHDGHHGHEGHKGHTGHAAETDEPGTELMSPHMLMTKSRPVRSEDEEHARHIIDRLRVVLEPFRDHEYALEQGYKIFLPQLPQEEYHFNNPRNGIRARSSFDIERPTSLLYRKVGGDYRLEGVMYTAPIGTPLEELDRRVPFSLTNWHAHVNVCMPPSEGGSTGSRGRLGSGRAGRRGLSGLRGGGAAREMFGPNARFGPRGSIATEEECREAGGRWRPEMFGWMVHVYPFRDTLEKAFEHSPGHSAGHGH